MGPSDEKSIRGDERGRKAIMTGRSHWEWVMEGRRLYETWLVLQE